MDYAALGRNIKRHRQMKGLRQQDLAELCGCTISHIGQVENARTIPSLAVTVQIANAHSVTVDQLLRDNYSEPERVYLKEIAERIEKYPVSKRILACESLTIYLDSLEKFSQ